MRKKLYIKHIEDRIVVTGEKRRHHSLREIINSAPNHHRTALVFLARGAVPDKLDAFEKINMKDKTPLASIRDELEAMGKGYGTRIVESILNKGIPVDNDFRPPLDVKIISRRGIAYAVVLFIEDFEQMTRKDMLKTGNIGNKCIYALGNVLAKHGVYFKGERP